MSDFKKQENGALGEARSKSILMDDFWILTRSIDADGADLIVQEKFDTFQEIKDSRGQPIRLAFIQAKFFEGNNQVNINKNYIINSDGEPRKGFIAFLHTRDDDKNPVNYIFNSEEIIRNWKQTEDESEYYFSLRNGRTYKDFKNLAPNALCQKVKAAIQDASRQSLGLIWNKAADEYSSVRYPSCCYPKYKLVNIYNAKIAIFDGGDHQAPHPLEPRRDIYRSWGEYEWGYEGSGPRLLAVSLLTHFFCGRHPRKFEINNVVDYLVSRVKGDDISFGKEEIFKALALIPYSELIDENSPDIMREMYNQIIDEYKIYFSEPDALVKV